MRIKSRHNKQANLQAERVYSCSRRQPYASGYQITCCVLRTGMLLWWHGCHYTIHKGRSVIAIATATENLSTKERILSVCVKLFLEQGYKKTTVSDIVQKANVSNSSFQHFFRAKDGVLTELVRFMFENQFNMARSVTDSSMSPVYVYAVETAIQITLTELNENLREIYLEAYTHEEALDFIQQATAKVLYHIFGPYQPDLTEHDFYILELGTSGLMRGYMAHPCDKELTLEQKLHSFLASSLRVYRVPEAEVQKILTYVISLDIRAISQRVLKDLFRALAMHFDFHLDYQP